MAVYHQEEYRFAELDFKGEVKYPGDMTVSDKVDRDFLYGTATIRDGRINFRSDIHKREPALLNALDGPFKIRGQDR